MAVGTRGVVIAWGSNGQGQLGLAKFKDSGDADMMSLSYAIKKWVKDTMKSGASKEPMKGVVMSVICGVIEVM